jgi:hypothetical protein
MEVGEQARKRLNKIASRRHARCFRLIRLNGTVLVFADRDLSTRSFQTRKLPVEAARTIVKHFLQYPRVIKASGSKGWPLSTPRRGTSSGEWQQIGRPMSRQSYEAVKLRMRERYAAEYGSPPWPADEDWPGTDDATTIELFLQADADVTEFLNSLKWDIGDV